MKERMLKLCRYVIPETTVLHLYLIVLALGIAFIDILTILIEFVTQP